MVRAFVDVFPQSVLLSGKGRELILFGTTAPALEFDPAQVAAALNERPAVRADLEKVSLSSLTELVGTFAASHETLVAATKSVLPLTDDVPTLEYSERSDALDTQLPADLIDVTQVARFCPRCFENGQTIASVGRLTDYLGVLGQVYESAPFRESSVFGAPANRVQVPLKLPPHAEALFATSPYLQSMVRPIK
jgi:hypothetical protein